MTTDTIESLRQQLAECERERDELKTWLEDQVCEAKDFAYKLEGKTVELATVTNERDELVADAKRYRYSLIGLMAIERFAQAVAAHERESCAKECDVVAALRKHPLEHKFRLSAQECATNIRRRQGMTPNAIDQGREHSERPTGAEGTDGVCVFDERTKDV